MHAPCLRAQTKEQSGGLDAKNYPGFPWLPANKADKSWATPMEDVSGVLFAHERAQVALAEWLVDNMSAKTPTRFIYSSAELPVQWAIEFLQLTDTGSLGVFRFNCRGKRAIVRKLTLDLRRALGVKPAPPPPVRPPFPRNGLAGRSNVAVGFAVRHAQTCVRKCVLTHRAFAVFPLPQPRTAGGRRGRGRGPSFSLFRTSIATCYAHRVETGPHFVPG